MKTYKALFFCLLGLIVSSCLTETIQKKSFTTYQPVHLADNWEVSTPEAERVNPDSLTKIYQEVQNDQELYWQARSMSVFRNGKLIAESYFKDETDRTTPRPVWSCTKQVMSLLIGIAIDKGLIRSVHDSIGRYLPQELANHPDKKIITIADLLTMQSGIDFDNDGIAGDDAAILEQKPSNLLQFVLDKPMQNKPGTVFHYKDGDPQILSAILEKVTGKSTQIWANEVLFSRIGITNWEWITYRDGITIGAFGILTTPRELAKIAQCVLNGGRFNNQQIVSEAWVAEMTKKRVVAIEHIGLDFGYLWWIYAEQGINFMSGNGGQIAMIIPAQKLIVVFTAEDKTQGKFRFSTIDARSFVQKIVRISY